MKYGFGYGFGNNGGGVVYDTDAEAFFTAMVSAGDPVPTAYKTLYNATIVQLKAVKGVDGTTSLWNSADIFRIYGTYSKTAALKNLKRNGVGDGTITNDHGGSFTTDVGLTGNGSNFRVSVYNPGDGGTYLYTSGSCMVGIFITNDTTTGITGYELSGVNAGSTQGTFMRPMNTSGNDYRFDGEINTGTVSNGVHSTIRSKGWFSLRRSSTNSRRQNNGVFLNTDGGATTLLNVDLVEYCLNSAGSYSFFSARTHAALYAGSSNLDENKIMGILQSYFFNPIANSNTTINSRVIFKGDSMTGDNTSPGFSNASDYPRKALITLGTNWTGVNLGVASQTLATALTNIAEVSAFRNTYMTKDIVCLFQGTNDLATNLGATATYNATVSYANTLTALGFKVVIIGVVDRDSNFAGITQANFDIQRAALRTSLLAQFGTATATSGVFLYSGTDFSSDVIYCDPYVDSAFTNAADTTYFQVDTVHLNTTGTTRLGQNFAAPAIALF